MFREDFHCIVEIKNNDSYTKDDAFKTLQIINTWISNIDTKTSFCLAFCAVMIGILRNIILCLLYYVTILFL